MEAAERALLEQLEPLDSFGAVAQGPALHVRILADQELHIAFQLIDALDPEADMLETGTRGVLAVEIGDLPRDQHQRDATVREIEVLVLWLIQRLEPEDFDIEFRAAFGMPRSDREVRDGARLRPIVLGIDVLLVHLRTRDIEDVAVGIVPAVRRERPDRWAFHRMQRRIEFRDPRHGILDVVDLDAEMI